MPSLILVIHPGLAVDDEQGRNGVQAGCRSGTSLRIQRVNPKASDSASGRMKGNLVWRRELAHQCRKPFQAVLPLPSLRIGLGSAMHGRSRSHNTCVVPGSGLGF